MYSIDKEANAVDENEVRRLRWEPRIRNYDDDNVEPEGDGDKADDANADADATGGDAAATDNDNATE